MTEKDKDNVIDWLNEIITNPEWQRFYSESETVFLAEQAKQMVTVNLVKECLMTFKKTPGANGLILVVWNR